MKKKALPTNEENIRVIRHHLSELLHRSFNDADVTEARAAKDQMAKWLNEASRRARRLSEMLIRDQSDPVVREQLAGFLSDVSMQKWEHQIP